MALVQWFGTTLLFSAVESGKLTAGDRIRWTDVLYGPTALCYASQPARGAFGTNNFNSIGINRAGWVVNQSSVDNQRGGIGKLTIEWEAGGTDAVATLPSGECRLDPQELYPRVERNLFFAALLAPNVKLAYNAAYLATEAGATGDVFKGDLFGTPASGSSPASPAKVYGADGVTPDATQAALAQSLFQKLLRGNETFYVAGWRYTSVVYSYVLPAINIGGVIQSPNGIGQINIVNSSISWLRLADVVEPAGVNGSMWKITRTWLGGPSGHWDGDLYPST